MSTSFAAGIAAPAKAYRRSAVCSLCHIVLVSAWESAKRYSLYHLGIVSHIHIAKQQVLRIKHDSHSSTREEDLALPLQLTGWKLIPQPRPRLQPRLYTHSAPCPHSMQHSEARDRGFHTGHRPVWSYHAVSRLL